MATMTGEKVSWFENGMNGWRNAIQVSERTLIDNVAATVPWLAPVSPAYMVWHNAVSLLGWPVWVAWVMAAAVEGLGLSVVSTAFQLWREKRNTFWIGVTTTGFYLVVVITVNVALELGAPAWLAKALLSLLSVPAAVTIALRTQNAQDVEEVRLADSLRAEAERLERERGERLELERLEREHAERLEAEQLEYHRQVDAEERARRHELKRLAAEKKLSESFPRHEENFRNFSGGSVSFGQVSSTYADWRHVPPVEREKIGKMTVNEIMVGYGKSKKTASNWLREALKHV